MVKKTGVTERRVGAGQGLFGWKKAKVLYLQYICQCGVTFWLRSGANPKSCGCLLTPAQRKQRDERRVSAPGA